MDRRLRLALVLGVALVACKAKEATTEQASVGAPAPAPEAPPPATAVVAVADEADSKDRRDAFKASAPAQSPKAGAAPRGQAAADKTTKTPEGPTRAWFPETFLFEPLVVTDDRGAAVVPVRVPDRLTTWRVLALAHSRTGAQGGAVASFLGTLPTYVEPVVPAFLVEGDTVRLPIQIVNTTASEVASSLDISAQNARIIGPVATKRVIPAQGSTLDYATLVADRAGPVVLRVSLGGTDAVERTIQVWRAGQLITEERSGTLAAPRTFTIPSPQIVPLPRGAPPDTGRVRLLVFPGALGLLRSELAASATRGDVADDAHALLLAGRAGALLRALGDTPDPAQLRELAIVAAQRAIRDGRTLDVDRATLLVEPALAHPDNPVLARLGERAVATLAQAQRPDGTFSGASGWTLQRLLVVTADATRAVTASVGPNATPAQRHRALQVVARAAGAFARTAEQVSDGYTAAAILASHAVTGELAESLRRRVRDSLKPRANDARYLAVDEGVARADGTVPTEVEATALAVLALDGDAQAPLADLGTTLLGGYTPARGWGDGRVNLLAMQAVLALFKAPLPTTVTIALTMDGAPILRGTLEGAKLRDVLSLDAITPSQVAAHIWKLTAEPAVPGLGYALAFDRWLPWRKQTPHGLELVLAERIAASVGKPVTVSVAAAAPAGTTVNIYQSLPAGVQVDVASLTALVDAGTIERFALSDGIVHFRVPAQRAGTAISLTYRAIPTFAGTLHSSASRILSDAGSFTAPPTTWTIK